LLSCGLVAVLAANGCSTSAPAPQDSQPTGPYSQPTGPYPVASVVDGDTIRVTVDGVEERVRVLGIDTPELHNPVECFGQEATDHATSLLTGASVELLRDDSQDDRDRYGRLLRYVFLPDGTNLSAHLVANGYAFEYTFDGPYLYQDLLQQDEVAAQSRGVGLWSASTCNGRSVTSESAALGAVTSPSGPSEAPAGCVVKGNINTKGDKIYHVPGDDSYDETVITESKGERYFCTTQEAEAAGWRAALR
jgi:micrococcal nuclease